jgi:predicted secreted protein
VRARLISKACWAVLYVVLACLYRLDIAMAQAPPELPAIEITKQDGSAVVGLRRGQPLIVSLPVQLGTGFAWHFADSGDSEPIVRLLRVEISEIAGMAAMPGATETQKFIFTAVAPGRASLEFRLARGNRTQPVDRFDVKVTVE